MFARSFKKLRADPVRLLVHLDATVDCVAGDGFFASVKALLESYTASSERLLAVPDQETTNTNERDIRDSFSRTCERELVRTTSSGSRRSLIIIYTFSSTASSQENAENLVLLMLFVRQTFGQAVTSLSIMLHPDEHKYNRATHNRSQTFLYSKNQRLEWAAAEQHCEEYKEGESTV